MKRFGKCDECELCLMWRHVISLLPGDSWGDVVFALVVVTISDEILTHILHLASSEGRTVVKPSVQDSRLPRQQFNQLSHLTELDTLFEIEKCNKDSVLTINPLWFTLLAPNVDIVGKIWITHVPLWVGQAV